MVRQADHRAYRLQALLTRQALGDLAGLATQARDSRRRDLGQRCEQQIEAIACIQRLATGHLRLQGSA